MFCPRDLSVFLSCVVLLVVQSSHGAEIIGGKVVRPHSLPYMALLPGKERICGGILIDPKWVLTSAHCANFSIKRVLLGVHSIISQKDEKSSRQTLKVKSWVPHPSYNETEKVNDLMLLRLKKSAKQTKTVKCLHLGKTIKDPAGGSTCMVAGWGMTDNNIEKMSDVLMSVKVTVVNRVKCNEYYNSKPVITNDMICAGSKNADTCKGDSGGPLFCNGALVGVTSFGPKPCGQIKPGVYASLSQKLEWIKKTMKKSKI